MIYNMISFEEFLENEGIHDIPTVITIILLY